MKTVVMIHRKYRMIFSIGEHEVVSGVELFRVRWKWSCLWLTHLICGRVMDIPHAIVSSFPSLKDLVKILVFACWSHDYA